ncbi:MAG: hypothetical protein KF901_27575 [Myxococcales bacterium]|nr:hypothetical protein [Myxococcales bacterium]
MLRWADLRAALLLFVLGVSAIQGCPVPRVQPHQVDRPIGQRELARWSRILGVPAPELRERVLDVSAEASRALDTLGAPFAPFYERTLTTQRWSLFPLADPDPWWMHVEGRRVGGPWELLYRPNDPQHARLADVLEYRRIRGTWNPGATAPRDSYPRFVDWIARELLAQEPELDEIRVRFSRYHINLPHEAPDDTTSWHFEERRRR